MTLFAVACAGMFPLLHMGRPWLFYWMFPYPNTMGVWPQFRSPLVWDVFAVSTYATVSLLFWYVGLMPDLATLRDRATNRMRARRLRHSGHGLARLGAPLAALRNGFSAAGRTGHAAGAFGAHGGQLRLHHRHRPGWHTTFSRPTSWPAPFTPASPWCWRWRFRCAGSTAWKDCITDQHLDNFAKVMLATGLIVAYGYMLETFTAWYSGDVYESAALWNRMTGPYACAYWFLITCNIVAPQLLWFKTRPQQADPAVLASLVVLSACGWSVRDHRHQPGAGLSAVFLGHLPPHPLGLGDLRRHHRPVHVPVLPFHPAAADDLDL